MVLLFCPHHLGSIKDTHTQKSLPACLALTGCQPVPTHSPPTLRGCMPTGKVVVRIKGDRFEMPNTAWHIGCVQKILIAMIMVAKYSNYSLL